MTDDRCGCGGDDDGGGGVRAGDGGGRGCGDGEDTVDEEHTDTEGSVVSG